MSSGESAKSNRLGVVASDVVGSLGFGLMLSCMLVCFMSDGMGAAFEEWPLGFAALRACGMSAFAATLFAVQFFSDKLSERTMLSRILAASTALIGVPSVVLYIGSFAALPFAAPVLCWLAIGTGLGLAFPLWSVFSSLLPEKAVPLLTATAFLAAGIWAGFLLQSMPTLHPAGVALSIALSAVLFAGYTRSSAIPASITRDESRASVSLSPRTNAAICCYGAVAVLAFQLLAAEGGAAGALIACASFALASAAAATVIVLISGGDDPFTFSHSQRIAFPLLVAGLLGLVLDPGGIASLIAVALVLFGYFFIDVFNWATLSQLASRYRSQPLYLFAQGRYPLALGLAIGWIVVAAFSQPESPVPLASAPLAPALGVLALSVTVAVAPYGSDTLTDKRAFDKLNADPMYSKDVEGGLFKRACLSVAQDNGLTPREREVLLLLAKGRSAAIIQEELTISAGTVRTHTYHIYRKLGVSSQQEVITMVESVIATFRAS